MTSDRVARSLAWLRGVALGGLLHLRIDAAPAPASRPIVARNGGVFFSKGYTHFYAECQKQLATQTGREGCRIEGRPVAVYLDFATRRPKSSKLPAPRGDVDNFAKGPLDAAKKSGIWTDDCQVRALAVTKRWAEEGEEEGVNFHVGLLKD